MLVAGRTFPLSPSLSPLLLELRRPTLVPARVWRQPISGRNLPYSCIAAKSTSELAPNYSLKRTAAKVCGTIVRIAAAVRLAQTLGVMKLLSILVLLFISVGTHAHESVVGCYTVQATVISEGVATRIEEKSIRLTSTPSSTP